MKTVFIDTSGLFALIHSADPFHPSARDVFIRAQQQQWDLVTTSYVVHEAWALIQNRLGWDAVEDWLTRIMPHCRIIWVDSALSRRRCCPLSPYSRAPAQPHRLRLARMDAQNHVTLAIVQDEHFIKEGIRLP